uniref:Prolactin regulatory element-binding protein n=1 Tax=Ascaris suum TaxID=6253 RepID=F1L5W7_ASCSU
MGSSPSKKQPPIIAQCSAPAYCVKSVGSRHILLAGGGGAAKTGVANHIETLLLSFDRLIRRQPSSNVDGIAMKAHLTSTIKTDPHATMNMDVICIGMPEYGRYLLAAGHDQYCDIYESKGFALSSDKIGEDGRSLLTLNFEQITRIQTDEKPGQPYQKVVRFDRSIIGQPRTLVTGGADGCIRVWDVDALYHKDSSTKPKPLLKLLAHNGDVDDLDISPDGRTVVSIGHDAHVYLWAMNDGKKLMELPHLTDIGKQFRVRSIRFTILGSANVIFVAAYNQIRRSSKSISYLALWAFNRDRCVCKSILVKEACRETISTLAVSECGNFTAIGTLSGSVGIFDTHEMKALYMAHETHGIFVTGIEFLPRRTVDFLPLRDYDGSRQRVTYPGIASEYRAAIVSLSADQTVQFHAVPFSQPSSFTAFTLKLSIIAALLYYIVWFLTRTRKENIYY